MPAHWYETFFTGIALDLWRNVGTPELTRAEADFLAAELNIKPGDHLLDVPCGNGRHAIELARRGVRVTGVDLASEFIAEARASAAAEALPADFIHADMRCLPAGPFDAAYCMGNSFGYLEDGGSEAFLAAVADALEPGARFILDTGHLVESLVPNLAGFEKAYIVGDISMSLKHDYDPLDTILRTQYSFSRGGETDVRSGEAHLYTAGELGRMLRRAGFRRLAAYASIQRDPYGVGAHRLFLLSELAPRSTVNYESS